MLPLTTYFLSVSEIGIFAFITMLANLIISPISTGGSLVINSYYFNIIPKRRRSLFSHLYLFEILLKVFMFIISITTASVFLEYLFNDFQSEYQDYFIFSCLNIVLASTRYLYYHLLVVQKNSSKFFLITVTEIFLNISFVYIFLGPLGFGLKGYFLGLCLSTFIMLIIELVNVKGMFHFKLEKVWIRIIWNKGIKLFYGGVLENILSFYESFLVQKSLSAYSLGLYTHAKKYITSFGIIDKSFYQSYSVDYLEALKNRAKSNHNTSLFYWYLFVLLVGISAIFLSKDVINFLTHNKMGDSSKILIIFFFSIFFRSNQQQYNYQLIFHKKNAAFVNISMLVNIICFIILTFIVFQSHMSLEVVAWVFVLNSFLKNMLIKCFAISLFKKVDISEFYFWISLLIYSITFVFKG